MPVIKVWCLPPDQSEEDLNRLHRAIVAAVCRVKELGIHDQNEIACLFVPDLMKYGLGEEIIVEIEGLFKKMELIPDVYQRLAFSVGVYVNELYPKARVKCFVRTFDPTKGFWASLGPELCPECGQAVVRNGPLAKCFSCGWYSD